MCHNDERTQRHNISWPNIFIIAYNILGHRQICEGNGNAAGLYKKGAHEKQGGHVIKECKYCRGTYKKGAHEKQGGHVIKECKYCRGTYKKGAHEKQGGHVI